MGEFAVFEKRESRGRRPLDPEAGKMTLLRVRIPAADRAALLEEAEGRDQVLSEYVREVIAARTPRGDVDLDAIDALLAERAEDQPAWSDVVLAKRLADAVPALLARARAVEADWLRSRDEAGSAYEAGYRDGRTAAARTVETAEELDALPENAAIVDRHDDLWQRHGNRWYAHETQPTFSNRIIRKWGPVRVVFVPPAPEEHDRA